MNKNQNINITRTYNPNRSSNLASFLPVGNVNRNTPAYTGAIIGQGFANMANTTSSLVLDFYEHKKGLEEKIQHTANNNGMMEYQTFARHVVDNFKPQVDSKKSTLEINNAINDLKTYSSSLEGLDAAGKDAINQQIKVAQITLDQRQTYGRMELVAFKEMAIAKTNFNDAIKSGDHKLLEQYYNDLESKGTVHSQPLEYYHSKANLANINNNIHNMNVEQLKVVDEELQNVSDNGDGVVYNLKQDDNIRARKMVAHAVSVRQNNLYDQVEKLEREGTLDFEKVKELFATGDMPLKVFNNFRSQLNSIQKTTVKSSVKNSDKSKLKYSQDLFAEKLYDAKLPKNKIAQNIAVDKLRSEMMTFKNSATRLKFKKLIDEKVKAVNTPDKSYLNDRYYNEGIAYIKQLKKDSKLYYDPDGLGNKESSEEFQYSKRSEMIEDFSEYFQKNQKLNPSEYIKYINEKKDALNKGQIKNIFKFGMKKKNQLFNSGARIQRNKSSRNEDYSLNNYLSPSYKNGVESKIVEK